MAFPCRLSALLLTAAWLAAAVCSAAWLRADDSASQTDAPQAQAENSLEDFDPARDRTETDQDRIEAAALFATGRMLVQKERYAEALRYCQRAYRADPTSATILEQIVSLAIELERQEVAARYALVLLELGGEIDQELGRHFASYLSERGELERAARLYRRLLPAAAAGETNIAQVLLHLNAGRIYFLLEDFAQASQALELVDKALEDPAAFGVDKKQTEILRGDSGLTLQLLGVAYLEADRLDDAQRLFGKLHSLYPDGAQFGFNMARVELKRKNPQAAFDHLQAYLNGKKAAEGPAPYKLYAQLLQQLERGDEVVAALDKLLEGDLDNVSLVSVLLARQIEQQDFRQAAMLLDRVNHSISTESQPFAAELLSPEIRIRYELKQVPQMLELVRRVVHGAKTLSGIEKQLQPIVDDDAFREALFKQQSSRTDETTAAERAARAEEAYAAAHLALWAGDIALAERLFASASRRLPEQATQWRLAWGLELFLKEEYEAAAQVFRQGVRAESEIQRQAVFQFYLAGALEMSGKTDEALAAAQASADADPDSAERAARVAWIHYHAEQYDQALAEYQELLGRFGDKYDSLDNRAALRSARLALSNIYIAKDDPAAAEEMLELVLDEFPEDVGAMNDLGYLWSERNVHLNRAFRMILRAVAAEPENQAYLDSLGWIQYRLGRFADAVETLQKAVGTGDDADGVILEHLADAHAANGQQQEARAVWQRALEKFEKQDEKEKAAQIRRKLRGEPPDKNDVKSDDKSGGKGDKRQGEEKGK